MKSPPLVSVGDLVAIYERAGGPKVRRRDRIAKHHAGLNAVYAAALKMASEMMDNALKGSP
jgi:hypothetical protein